MSDYDVVVIGSGAGGLTAAVALANAGKKVLVLEQHYMAGGWCQSFVLEGYRYSPGVHYVGELGPGQSFSRIYEGLGVSRDLEFCRLNDEGYDHYIVAGERFDVPSGVDRYRDRLKERFPNEREGIDAYFDLVLKVSREASMMAKYSSGLKVLQLPFRAPNVILHGLRKLGGFLDKHISDPLLRAYLVAPAGDYGLPPSDAAFALHAGLVAHYFGGAYYPRGGAYRIPRAYVRQLKRKGGSIRLSTRVRRILLEDGQAVGVELEDGERISAETVVSNADAEVTLGKLVGREHLSGRLVKKLNRTEWSIASLGLFLATDMDLKGLGYDSGNYWYYKTTDVDRIYAVPPAKHSDDEFDGAFLTITTLKDPSKRRDGIHTVEVFTFMPHDYFGSWENSSKGERGEDYDVLKERMAQRLLKTADRIIPDLSKNLVFREAATPVTNEYYCAGFKGHMYGPAKTRRQIGPGAFPTRTEIPGLFMVGASTLSHGVIGVTYSGLVAAAQVLGCGMSEVLRERGPALTVYPSEQPEEWLDNLKQKRNSAGDRDQRGLEAEARPAP